MKKATTFGTLALLIALNIQLQTPNCYAQCASVNINGDFIQSSTGFLSGTYNVSGTFHIQPGVTIYVEPYSSSNCGELVVYAQNIKIEGDINGDFSGYTGGVGGDGGTLITSLTGDEISIYDCSNNGNTGQVTVSGGIGGVSGEGAGAGTGGMDGMDGSGPKQQCTNVVDYSGMIGGAGGGGGGSGGSYGGNGTTGGIGGAGADTSIGTGIIIAAGFPVVGGEGGNPGMPTTIYGSDNGNDIDMGSGGGGAGGGGHGFDGGVPGGKGGNGGGMVKLIASDSLIILGTISVNGKDGEKGGDGGVGGQSLDCCSDPCDDCGEKTFSCGAGGGSGSGGGSGGGILLLSDFYAQVTGSLSATGGNGGSKGFKGTGVTCVYDAGSFCGDDQQIMSGDGYDGENGGGGGGGRIKVFYPDCSGNNINPIVQISGGNGPNITAGQGSYAASCNTGIGHMISGDQLKLKLYPNPSSDKLNIQWNRRGLEGSVYIQVVNILNQTVVALQGIDINRASSQIDIKNLPPGIYYCHIQMEGLNTVKMFVKY